MRYEHELPSDLIADASSCHEAERRKIRMKANSKKSCSNSERLRSCVSWAWVTEYNAYVRGEKDSDAVEAPSGTRERAALIGTG